MNSRHRAVVMLAGLAIATLYMGLAKPTPAQPQCPPGTTLCRSDTGWIFCGDCGVPDSGSTDSVMNFLIMMPPSSQTTSGFSAGLVVPRAGVAVQGATLEMMVRSSSAALADVRLLRQQIRDQWKWSAASGATELSRAPKTTFKVMQAGKTVASVSGSTVMAEFAEFPSRFAVTTSAKTTTVTWAFAGPVEVGITTSPDKPAAMHQGDALAITFASGSSSGLTRLDLGRRGIGPLDFQEAKPTLMQAAASSR